MVFARQAKHWCRDYLLVDDAALSTPDQKRLSRLKAGAPVIAPSMLLCDFGNLEREIRMLESAGVEVLHLDVMDGHFVPNLTYGMPIVEAARKLTKCVIDVHLMISEPAKYVQSFHDAGADIITIHAEAVSDPLPVLESIRAAGARSGLAINPETAVSSVSPCANVCDLILVMSVSPGFGGQSFDPRALEKLEQLKRDVPPTTILEVDGGVNDETIRACSTAGADVLVVGSAIFRHDNYSQRVQQLREIALANN